MFVFKGKRFKKSHFPTPLILEPAKFGQRSRESQPEPVRISCHLQMAFYLEAFFLCVPGTALAQMTSVTCIPGKGSPHSRVPQCVNTQKPNTQAKEYHQVHHRARIIRRTQICHGGDIVSCLWVLGLWNPAHNYLLGKSSSCSEPEGNSIDHWTLSSPRPLCPTLLTHSCLPTFLSGNICCAISSPATVTGCPPQPPRVMAVPCFQVWEGDSVSICLLSHMELGSSPPDVGSG